MSVHDVIHDLHPTLQRDDLDGEEGSVTTKAIRKQLEQRSSGPTWKITIQA